LLYETIERNRRKVMIARVEATGMFDESVDDLRKRVIDLPDCDLVLSCKGFSHISSMWIGEIMHLFVELRKDNRKLILASVEPRVLQQLHIQQLHKVLDIAPDEETALSLLT